VTARPTQTRPGAAEPSGGRAGEDGTLDLVGVGSALVDLTAQVKPEELSALGLEPGTMTLVDEAGAGRLAEAVRPRARSSGGSVANTVVGVAALGGRAGFVGCTGDDELGRVFREDLAAAGVVLGDGAPRAGGATGRCLVLVTPDGQRTMATFLGVATDLRPEDLDPVLLQRAAVVYLEGYLLDVPRAAGLLERAVALAHEGEAAVALGLSDPLLVARHRDRLLGLLEAGSVDVVVGNAEEARALAGSRGQEAALGFLEELGVLGAVTLGGEGAVVVAPEDRYRVPARAVPVVDTTGAGDLFAAGFLYGLARGAGPGDAARLGTAAAATVLGHLGGRPEGDLRALVAEVLGATEPAQGASSGSGSGGR
jgi:sugar/nucleoside kinase (ribokinase family)